MGKEKIIALFNNKGGSFQGLTYPLKKSCYYR